MEPTDRGLEFWTKVRLPECGSLRGEDWDRFRIHFQKVMFERKPIN